MFKNLNILFHHVNKPRDPDIIKDRHALVSSPYLQIRIFSHSGDIRIFDDNNLLLLFSFAVFI